MDEGRKSVGQIQGITANGDVKNIRTDENGNLLTANEVESVIFSDYFEVAGEKTIEISGQMTSIEVGNYSEDSEIQINGVVIGPNVATTLSGKTMSTPLTITGNTNVYLLVKGVV